ncbi:cytochrome C assembly family protein [Marinobacterium sedimentorum]|uniref:cytochrome C assembly family protein n=1 Tax=Marinobacterium sedimentorum TaxID=2927804 RepID=UPI0020C6E35E|nr:cytochrome c biogenesis protein CcsA [Marinobacterium sedimentorum]MCP8686040.1 cytochrome c biogenesis protein CcsA [Marinobacterium sedimentorum]
MLPTSILVAVLFYLAATLLQWRVLQGQKRPARNLIRGLGLCGVTVHALAVYLVIHQGPGLNLGFFSVGSQISWLLAALVLLSSSRQHIDNLFIGVFPLAIISLLTATLDPDTSLHRNYSAGLITHILLSILAYSIFTLATLQALLLWRQNTALKQHHTRGLVASLPPLQTMERLLFEMLWTGIILLSASLVSGFFFVEDFFAQHLIHKTTLSILAWIVYAILLAGHSLLGWRSLRAIRWTIGGFIALMLAFFGSKLVIEFFLPS